MAGAIASLVDTRTPSTPGYLGRLDLTLANGYVVQTIDIGFPEVRTVSDPITDGDGTFDYTANYGARAFTLSVGLVPEATPGATHQSLIDAMRAFMHPALRPVVQFKLSAADALRQVSVRADQSAFVDQFVTDDFAYATCGWRVPSGIMEGATVVSVMADPATRAGRTYPRHYARTYNIAGALIPAVATNVGTESVDPFVRFHGPTTGPSITLVESGYIVGLTRNGGAVVESGQWVDVDFRARTVVRSDGVNLYNTLDIPTQWWRLAPGANHVTFAANAWAGSAHAEVAFRPAWI